MNIFHSFFNLYLNSIICFNRKSMKRYFIFYIVFIISVVFAQTDEESISKKKFKNKLNTHYPAQKPKSSHYLSYTQFIEMIRSQGLRSGPKYRKWYKQNNGIFNGLKWPSKPDQFYKRRGEWEGWGALFPYATYTQFIEMIRSQGLRSGPKYRKWHKQNNGIFNGLKWPVTVDQFYKRRGEWEGWGALFPYATYTQFIEMIRSQGLRSGPKYRKWHKQNNGIFNGLKWPVAPDQFYKRTGEWGGWGALLGNNKCQRVFNNLRSI